MALVNTHPRDALIEFEPGPHKYTCKGEGNYMSVTTWNHTHFKAFDADAIITKMMSNPLKWANSPYYGKTREEIKAGWDKGRDEAAAAGTAMHKAIELWVGENYALNSPETFSQDNAGVLEDPMGGVGVSPMVSAQEGGVGVSPRVPPHFLKFVADHPHLKPYRAEWMIFDEHARLAGSIDMVYENPDGTLMIYDWKRCKEIKKNNSFGEFALTECINHLPDTNYWHYALQLNTYKTILEANYGKKVTQMCLVCLHPNLPSYQVWKVPVLAYEMAELFALRQSQVAVL
jgi:hypothetical protein